MPILPFRVIDVDGAELIEPFGTVPAIAFEPQVGDIVQMGSRYRKIVARLFDDSNALAVVVGPPKRSLRAVLALEKDRSK